MYVYQYPIWNSLKRKLYKLCVLERGDILIEQLAPIYPYSDLQDKVTHWRDVEILPYIVMKQKVMSLNEENYWQDLSALFYDAKQLTQELTREPSLSKQYQAWLILDTAEAQHIFWVSLNQYFYWARMNLDSGFLKTTRLKNWQVLNKLINELLNDEPFLLKHPALLARRLLDLPTAKPRDASNLEQILGYLYEFLPHLGIDEPDIQELLSLTPDIEAMVWLQECWQQLTPEEQQAITWLKLEQNSSNESSFQQHHQCSYETARRRANSGLAKLEKLFREEGLKCD
jgi:hypothetical protein